MKALGGFPAVRLVALLLALCCGLAPSAASAQDQPAFSQQQLDQLLAPIALYPDPLLSQMLMASTYPLEVAEAARWSRMHPELQGDDAVQAVAQETWDPSVKSLVAFPQVIAWMDENPEWTHALGDAFLSQEPQVMESVQSLRQRSQNIGTLRSDERIHVVEDGRTISVLPANPQIIYVPYYDPMVVYGTWMWPAYPPAHWRARPGYFVQPGYARFYWGPGITISTGFFFGACDWHRRQVRVVHVNNYYYRTPHRQVTIAAPSNVLGLHQGPGVWQHNPAHRRGIAYRGPAAQRYSLAPRAQGQESRRDDPTRRLQSPDRRGGNIQFADPRPDARLGARQATAGSAAALTSGNRPEGRLPQPAAGAAAPNPAEAQRPNAIRPEVRRAPASAAPANTAETARARELQPEIRSVQPVPRATASNPPDAPRARHWRSEAQSAQPEMRREAGRHLEPPRAVAPRAAIRSGHESPNSAVSGIQSEARNAGNRESGKSSEGRGRSGGREGNRGERR